MPVGLHWEVVEAWGEISGDVSITLRLCAYVISISIPASRRVTEAIRCLAHCVLSRSFFFSCFHSNTNPKDSRQVHVLTLLPYPLFNIQQRTAILTPWSKRIFGTRTRRVVSWFAADVYLVPLWVVMALNLSKGPLRSYSDVPSCYTLRTTRWFAPLIGIPTVTSFDL
jgi:hypothetical protein